MLIHMVPNDIQIYMYYYPVLTNTGELVLIRFIGAIKICLT